MMDHIDHILLRPVGEEAMVAVLAFGDIPFVEGLDHHHEAHLVAEFHELGRGHIVRGADGVAAHLLQERELVAQGGAVDRGAERAQVVVVAHALDLPQFSIQVESLLGDEIDGADTEAGLIFVDHLIVVSRFGIIEDLRHGLVEGRGLGRPKRRVHQPQGLPAERVGGRVGHRHHAALRIEDLRADAEQRRIVDVLDPDGDLHSCLGLVNLGRGDTSSPNGNMGDMGPDEMDVAVEARAGVPARRVGLIFEADFQEIVFSVRVEIRGHIDVEGVVAVGPCGHRLPVHADAGLAHRAVEQQGDGVPSRAVLRHVEMRAVPSLPHIRQAAGAAGVGGHFGFKVLRHLHFLQVVRPVEGALDGPVVRHGNGGPVQAVAAEFPRCEQGFLPGTFLIIRRAGCHQGKEDNQKESFHHIITRLTSD